MKESLAMRNSCQFHQHFCKLTKIWEQNDLVRGFIETLRNRYGEQMDKAEMTEYRELL